MSILWFWDDLFVSFLCFFTSISAFLYLNHLPRLGHWIEKSTTILVFIGSVGIAVTPFSGHYMNPTPYEVLLHMGVTAFSMWFTTPYWHELPLLNRRKMRCNCNYERRQCFH